ncbi:PASTA domain-containing protein [Xenococcus sp. PCC 7305]|uniref:PASTA domain-containing protein n=1 Tax=Xenococcus sp. PCC 7305 TaxID=102125 RepID=UPI000301B408|nr:PASTA domain-containing protein [Xenococcus sp. PCC 7305]
MNSCGKIKVASVTGEELGYAKGVLVGQGLQVKTVEKEIADVPEGQVLTQNPSPETPIKQGEFVTLVIAKSPLYSINGSIRLIDSKLGGYDDTCYGTGGYNDIDSGMSITVKDDRGTIIATGQTGSGSHPESSSYSSMICVFKFDIIQVPKRNFYTIDFGRRGQLNYSFEKLEEIDWQITLSVG